MSKAKNLKKHQRKAPKKKKAFDIFDHNKLLRCPICGLNIKANKLKKHNRQLHEKEIVKVKRSRFWDPFKKNKRIKTWQ